MTTILKPLHVKRPKRAVKTVVKRATKSQSKRSRETKTVVEYKRWLLANAGTVGKWARENTKRLTGKEIL